jgi:hypothetical protein
MYLELLLWTMVEDVEVMAEAGRAVQAPSLRNWASQAGLVEVHNRIAALERA